jgi:hypothetical protein
MWQKVFFIFIVSCGNNYHTDWKVNHSRLENRQRYLKSNDVVNLSTKKFYDNNGEYIKDGYEAFLRSHDIQFTIGNDTFQELVCHNERLGGNDEVSYFLLFVILNEIFIFFFFFIIYLVVHWTY